MTPGMIAGLRADRILIAGLIKVALDGYDLLLCDGSAAITFGSDVYTGDDETYGTIGEIETISESIGDSAPGVDMTFLPPSLAAAVALANALPDRMVWMWMALVDPDTGIVVPDPDLRFVGEVDTVVIEHTRGRIEVKVSIVSVFDRLLEPDEAIVMSDTFHQSIFPGETGFANQTGTPIDRIWGPGDKPPAATLAPQVPRGGANTYF